MDTAVLSILTSVFGLTLGAGSVIVYNYIRGNRLNKKAEETIEKAKKEAEKAKRDALF